jgi:hypothetical protein
MGKWYYFALHKRQGIYAQCSDCASFWAFAQEKAATEFVYPLESSQSSASQCLRGEGWEPPLPRRRVGEAFKTSPLSLEQAVGIGQDPKGHLLLTFLVSVL